MSEVKTDKCWLDGYTPWRNKKGWVIAKTENDRMNILVEGTEVLIFYTEKEANRYLDKLRELK